MKSHNYFQSVQSEPQLTLDGARWWCTLDRTSIDDDYAETVESECGGKKEKKNVGSLSLAYLCAVGYMYLLKSFFFA